MDAQNLDPEEKKRLINEIFKELLETDENPLRYVDSEILKRLHTWVTKERRRRREVGGLRVQGYIYRKNVKYLPILIDYYYERGIIESRTVYAFVTYILNNFIEQIVKLLKEGNISSISQNILKKEG